MSSRLYPSLIAPSVIYHGPSRGTWEREGGFGTTWYPVQWIWKLSTTKVNAGATQLRLGATNQQGNYDWYIGKWTTDPLAAQTISGIFNLCDYVGARWMNGAAGPTNDSIVRYKVHIYITVGQTTTVRHVLLNNYVDSVNWVSGSVQWQSLASAQTLISGDALGGDCVVVEIGARIVSSPTPAPVYDPPNLSFYTELSLTVWGATTGTGIVRDDAIAGSFDSTLAPWMEFSHNFTYLSAPGPHANNSCLTAVTIPPGALPYISPRIVTSNGGGSNREAWYKWTPPTSGEVVFTTYGSNYFTRITVYRDGCTTLTLHTPILRFERMASHRNICSAMVNVIAGVEYHIQVENQSDSLNALNGGGVLQFQAFYRDTSMQADGDIYYPCGVICVFREGQWVNLNPSWFDFAPTGVAIDYSERSMASLISGPGDPNVHEKIYLGLHDYELVEILDLPTAGYGFTGFNGEIDFIGNPWSVNPQNIHPAQIRITAAGRLYVGWFGNGYLYIRGLGAKPSILNTVSDNVDFSALKSIDAINADYQVGAPFVDLLQYPSPQVTAAWAIAIDEVNNILYYTSGGFYVPVGGTEIRKFDLNTNTQLPVFATLSLQPGNNPGLKGLCLLSDGGLLVCNSTVVQRLNSSGIVTQTYTPSIAEDSQNLIHVELTPDGEFFWVFDGPTTRFFKFNLSTGAEAMTFQPYMIPGSSVQFVIYRGGGGTEPPPTETGLFELEEGRVDDLGEKIPNPFFKTSLIGS